MFILNTIGNAMKSNVVIMALDLNFKIVMYQASQEKFSHVKKYIVYYFFIPKVSMRIEDLCRHYWLYVWNSLTIAFLAM